MSGKKLQTTIAGIQIGCVPNFVQTLNDGVKQGKILLGGSGLTDASFFST